ncbi:HypC/HybG/HupF family hydrogenase formation chaperone [Litorisediminicola beolgyonensis]|uniref:HypC/HybG/HupF family hydrogenase formation chaperone n=1 Tax=Litorisediminicola beolgyonensis TaxID=1173614 RepID=A0ABW3ZL13_9RHOB
MCVGLPLRITAIDGIAARAEADGHLELIDLSLTPEARVGDWILTFLGAAREVISAAEAQKISAALAGLRAVMQGHDLGDAFADLEADGPQLPPHLHAALAAGQTTG